NPDPVAAPQQGIQEDDHYGDARPSRGGSSQPRVPPREGHVRRRMKFLALILKSARRSKRRTVLTIMSVALAVFLFAALRAVLDGFNAATEGSSSTRIITIRSTSLIFSMPTSHATGIRNTAGVQDLTWANWFGGIYKDPQNFFAQFAVEPES